MGKCGSVSNDTVITVRFKKRSIDDFFYLFFCVPLLMGKQESRRKLVKSTDLEIVFFVVRY